MWLLENLKLHIRLALSMQGLLAWLYGFYCYLDLFTHDDVFHLRKTVAACAKHSELFIHLSSILVFSLVTLTLEPYWNLCPLPSSHIREKPLRETERKRWLLTHQLLVFIHAVEKAEEISKEKGRTCLGKWEFRKRLGRTKQEEKACAQNVNLNWSTLASTLRSALYFHHSYDGFTESFKSLRERLEKILYFSFFNYTSGSLD